MNIEIIRVPREGQRNWTLKTTIQKNLPWIKTFFETIYWKCTLHVLEYWPQTNNTKAQSNKTNGLWRKRKIAWTSRKQRILFINERKLDYHQTFCQKKNGIIYLRHLGKKSRSQELGITQTDFEVWRATGCYNMKEIRRYYSRKSFLRNLPENELWTIKITRETSTGLVCKQNNK